jgi:hypothetical protein
MVEKLRFECLFVFNSNYNFYHNFVAFNNEQNQI